MLNRHICEFDVVIYDIQLLMLDVFYERKTLLIAHLQCVALLVNVVADSLAWYERSKDGHAVCANCVRKYNGAMSIVSVEPGDSNAEPPPFMFRPVKEEQDIVWKHVCTSLCMLSRTAN